MRLQMALASSETQFVNKPKQMEGTSKKMKQKTEKKGPDLSQNPRIPEDTGDYGSALLLIKSQLVTLGEQRFKVTGSENGRCLSAVLLFFLLDYCHLKCCRWGSTDLWVLICTKPRHRWPILDQRNSRLSKRRG
ncbi:hypothetical protein OUZ56_008786 [Daphnia magna]|uniref:Uncharacterized protein n=1 Tax=Daphnia magna TaxID=35525 RepID=A0ABR0AE25_9CRUS|nr:hypothetical protein OUZ56_008786 [Daphnia magna]